MLMHTTYNIYFSSTKQVCKKKKVSHKDTNSSTNNQHGYHFYSFIVDLHVLKSQIFNFANFGMLASQKPLCHEYSISYFLCKGRFRDLPIVKNYSG